ncbi:amino acid ABC transporter ATP-binding protein, partial [Aurantimonas sp. 22II-16-19i]|uniref:amino acid ABC transporter ATP-binding protein n=1 Tax=Aurantimonas sp. 22II-16-19i TaxID=1317114 RepID=UPI0009F7A540
MIRLSGIEKSFSGNLVLKGVNLAVQEGAVTALIGPSGSGKSTLLRCANLLETPDAGTVEIGDVRLEFSGKRRPSQSDVLRLRRRTGMIFQNFQLFPHQRVAENVMEALVTVQKWPKAKARERAMALLDQVGMSEKAEAWPATLSGGQQQRVAIARALAPSPALILCDEPTSALDPELAEEVVDVLRTLAKDGATMLMATHDLRLARSLASHVAFLEAGEIVEEGAPDAIFGAPTEPRTIRFV